MGGMRFSPTLVVLLLVAVLLLAGCQTRAERERERQAVADVGASIYEAAKAGEEGADLAMVLHAIKVASHAIIHSQGRKYDPADKWIETLKPATKEAP